MVRIDIWDVEKAEDSPSINCGFPRLFEERYSIDERQTALLKEHRDQNNLTRIA